MAVQDGSASRDVRRYAYESIIGPLPSLVRLDNNCGHDACINPAHMEPSCRNCGGKEKA